MNFLTRNFWWLALLWLVLWTVIGCLLMVLGGGK